jgi:ribosomal protein S18 acetylase RimI-like enzyme
MSTRAHAYTARRADNGNGTSPCPPAALTVRPAGGGDLVPLSFFFDTVLRKDYFLRRGQLADILNGQYHRAFVAEIDGVLVGIVIITRGVRLINALVHPAYRGLGIGQALVRSSGATEVRAKIDVSSGDPRGFYKSLGFVHTNEFNNKRNIELMRRAPNGNRRRVHQRMPARGRIASAAAGRHGNGRHKRIRK